MIKVSTNYLEHSGGTKFYETVLLAQDNAAFMLIKRWGKIAEKMGGGQTKIERYGDAFEANNAVQEIMKDKRKEKGAKGKYIDTAITPLLGFHAYNGADAQDPDVYSIAGHHYQDKVVQSSVNSFFDLMALNDDGTVAEDPPPAADTVMPEERGDTWGSW